jgi:phospholipid/cholesterol/gamma-HCH transport system permease protein
VNPVAVIESKTKDGLAELGRCARFIGRTFWVMFSVMPSWPSLLEELANIGFGSVAVVSCISIFVGMNIALQGYYTFKTFSAHDMVGVFVGLSCVREMGPVGAAAMVAAKCGTDMAARLGAMRVKQQIDAMEVMAVNPFWLLVVPKVIATIIVLPLLVVLTDFFSLIAGYAVAVVQLKINSGLYWYSVAQYLRMSDVWKGMIKGAVIGAIVSLVSCYCGYTASGGAEGVGKATNRAVVISCVLGIVINYFLSSVMFQ